jgi:hypothetical protein
MLPITATPQRCAGDSRASLTAEPTPALAADTAPMLDSIAGALVRPIPDPMQTIEPAIVT